MSALTDEEVGQKALESAGDFIKVTTGLATGALVFSVTLINNPAALSGLARVTLNICWIAFIVSVAAAVFVAQGRITTKIAEKNYDIHKGLWLTFPTIAHQWTFFVGIVALGVTLSVFLGDQPSTEQLKITKADEAVRLAVGRMPKGAHVTKIDSVELVKGIDPTDPTLTSWHVQFEGTILSPKKSNSKTAAVGRAIHDDAFVDAKTGDVYFPYQP